MKWTYADATQLIISISPTNMHVSAGISVCLDDILPSGETETQQLLYFPGVHSHAKILWSLRTNLKSVTASNLVVVPDNYRWHITNFTVIQDSFELHQKDLGIPILCLRQDSCNVLLAGLPCMTPDACNWSGIELHDLILMPLRSVSVCNYSSLLLAWWCCTQKKGWQGKIQPGIVTRRQAED